MVGDFYMLEMADMTEAMITRIDFADDSITFGGMKYAPTAAASDDSGLTAIAVDAVDFETSYMIYTDGMGGYIAITAVPDPVTPEPEVDLVYATYKFDITTPEYTYVDAYGVTQTVEATTEYFVQGVQHERHRSCLSGHFRRIRNN